MTIEPFHHWWLSFTWGFVLFRGFKIWLCSIFNFFRGFNFWSRVFKIIILVLEVPTLLVFLSSFLIDLLKILAVASILFLSFLFGLFSPSPSLELILLFEIFDFKGFFEMVMKTCLKQCQFHFHLRLNCCCFHSYSGDSFYFLYL